MTTKYISPVVSNIYPNINGLELMIAGLGSPTLVRLDPGTARANLAYTSTGTNVLDITLNSPTILNGAINGINGLDTGTLAANKIYSVHLIGDWTGKNSPAGLLSLSVNTPYLPSGYNCFRRVGQVVTDGSIHFRKFQQAGRWNERIYVFDEAIHVVTNSHAVVPTALDLSEYMPSSETNNQAWISTTLVTAVAGRSAFVRTYGATGSLTSDANVVGVGQVASIPVYGNRWVLTSIFDQLEYQLTDAADTLEIFLLGYRYEL